MADSYNTLREDVQIIKDNIISIKKNIQEIKDTLQEFKKTLIDIHEYFKRLELPKCSVCDCSYTKYCACGCGELTCECLYVEWAYEHPDGLYFHTLKCVERLKDNYNTSSYLKKELKLFIRTYKAQNT